MNGFTDFDAIQEGDRQSLTKLITEEDVRRFVELTGDINPLHVDTEYARKTAFKDIVVHGMLGASFISSVIGNQLPGPGALWVSQSFDFNLPVRLGDTLTVVCTVLRKHPRDRLLELDTHIENQHGQAVLSGKGKVRLLEAPTGSIAPPQGRLKVAIVTGASGGIGQAICERLAAGGFSVVVNYRSGTERALALVRKLTDAGSKAIAIQADVTQPADIQALIAATLRQFGGISVLVNAAAPRISPRSLETLRWDDLQQHLDGQLKSAFLMSQACREHLEACGSGRIISLGSQALEGPPVAGWIAYAIGKGTLSTFTRYLAAELGPRGVTVNLVSPGMTNTPFIGNISEKQQLMAARQTPLRRLGEPEDTAAAVAFLASDEAAYITGQNLRVNGGGAMPC